MLDHPRSRGVYKKKIDAMDDKNGSSPLARGLRNSMYRYLTLSGIIPARAGFTEFLLRSLRSPPDHPRSRGVYVQPRTEKVHGEGSSPLARGLLYKL